MLLKLNFTSKFVVDLATIFGPNSQQISKPIRGGIPLGFGSNVELALGLVRGSWVWNLRDSRGSCALVWLMSCGACSAHGALWGTCGIRTFWQQRCGQLCDENLAQPPSEIKGHTPIWYACMRQWGHDNKYCNTFHTHQNHYLCDDLQQ